MTSSISSGKLNNILPSNVKPSGLHIKVSAPGKVILHGEHSVVYGKLAVAAALGLRTSLHLVEIEDSNSFIINYNQLEFSNSYNIEEINKCLGVSSLKDISDFIWNDPEKVCHEDLLKIVDDFINVSGVKKNLSSQQISAQRATFYLIFGILGSVDILIPSIIVCADTKLKIGAGTGSSASFSVCLSAILVQYVRTRQKTRAEFSGTNVSQDSSQVDLREFSKTDLDMICKWAFNAEKIIHGTPSGIDNTICTYGSMVEFRKGTPPKLLPIKATIKILLINSKVPRETKVLVGKAASLQQKFPRVVDNIFNAIEELTVVAVEKIKALPAEKDEKSEGWNHEVINIYEGLCKLASINQSLLMSLGLSHPRLDEIIDILAQHRLQGKLTGAGGGGYAIAIVPPFFNQTLLENVQQVLKDRNFEVNFVTIGGGGVAIE